MSISKLNLLLIGTGGREHAMVRALLKSPSTGRLHCSPGSDAIAKDGAQCIVLGTPVEIVDYINAYAIDLVIIGPEQPLVDGLADILRAEGIAVFGPSAKAARLEASKDFTKRLCDKYQIPTARYMTFHDAISAKAYVNTTTGAPVVIKADGLAAGKGVTVAETIEQAEDAINACFAGQFGEAGNIVVVEECLIGEEVSFFALSDGHQVIPFGSAQDHKRAFDGDKGPNTGGMGTYSPAPIFTPALEKEVMERIITPAINGLAADNTPYIGVLFAGLMLTEQGPKLIEFNCRFGDPEAQVLLARFEGDFAALLHDCAQGTLNQTQPRGHFTDMAALCVVMAAKGYPGTYEKGTPIKKLDKAALIQDAYVLHAGTEEIDGQWRANGGRVLNVVAIGENLKQAHKRAYQAVSAIHWPKGFYRKDIAWRALK